MEPEDLITTKRQLRYLDAFDKAGGRLHKDEAAVAARTAGFDPRGTGGFYTYNGSLRNPKRTTVSSPLWVKSGSTGGAG